MKSQSPEEIIGEDWTAFLHHVVSSFWFEYYEKYRPPNQLKSIVVISRNISLISDKFQSKKDMEWFQTILCFPVSGSHCTYYIGTLTCSSIIFLGLLHDGNIKSLPHCSILRLTIINHLKKLRQNADNRPRNSIPHVSSFSILTFPLLFVSGSWPGSFAYLSDSPAFVYLPPEGSGSISSSSLSPSPSTATKMSAFSKNLKIFIHPG